MFRICIHSRKGADLLVTHVTDLSAEYRWGIERCPALRYSSRTTLKLDTIDWFIAGDRMR